MIMVLPFTQLELNVLIPSPNNFKLLIKLLTIKGLKLLDSNKDRELASVIET